MDKEIINKKRPSIRVIIIVSIIAIILAGIAYYKIFICIAEFKGRVLIYKGSAYEEYGTSNYQLGKFLCKTKDGEYTIYSIRGDDESNFLEVSSFLDNYLYKKVNYEVPKSGKVTAIYINGFYHDGEDIISVLQELETVNGESYSFETYNIYSRAVNIIYCYNDCPVGGKWICRIAHVDNKWIYINTNLNDSAMRGKDGSMQICRYKGIVTTDNKFISVLKKYISK